MHTTKTFKLVAETIRTRIAAEASVFTGQERDHREMALLDIAVDFAHHFEKENPRFEVSKFMNVVKGVKNK